MCVQWKLCNSHTQPSRIWVTMSGGFTRSLVMLEFACLRLEPRLQWSHTVQRWGVLPYKSLDFKFLSLCIQKPFTVAACLCWLLALSCTTSDGATTHSLRCWVMGLWLGVIGRKKNLSRTHGMSTQVKRWAQSSSNSKVELLPAWTSYEGEECSQFCPQKTRPGVRTWVQWLCPHSPPLW